MKQMTNALSNKVFYDEDRNIIIKEYINDEFKTYFENSEINLLNKNGIKCNVINKDKIEIEYIDHKDFYDKDIEINDIFSVVNALKKLHKIEVENIKYIDYKKIYKNVFCKKKDWSNCSIKESENKILEKAIKILKSGPQVILHNDLVKGNLLKTGKTIVLIDFEYAGLGNPIFDIASFITEHNLSAEQISLLVDCYDNKINKNDLLVVCAFLEVFWTRWALFKFEKTNREIYKNIANHKYSSYKKILKSIEIN